jgi:hypothetical protein
MMPGKPITAETRLLAAQIRVGDKVAIKSIVAQLKRCKGDVQATAEALGIAPRTLYLWRDVSEPFAAAFNEHVRSVGRQPVPKKKKRNKAA